MISESVMLYKFVSNVTMAPIERCKHTIRVCNLDRLPLVFLDGCELLFFGVEI